MSSKLVRILFAAALTGFLSLGSLSLSAADKYPMAEKLKQCEMNFKAARSKTATQEQAAVAREKHMKLMVEILQHLNTRNVTASKENRPLTPEELSNNVKVMGHLLEMLAIDHLPATPDWSYLY
ncbi:MAG TPA: hypothetical protein ENI74_07710 [Gammaproteobacteria bacterium]|nr:hypothetical protein [Gammaproteobacteria bacterium]